MNTGDLIELRGTSRHGKSRIKTMGHTWEVIRVEAYKILIAAENDLRWIDLPNDRDFEIVAVIPPTKISTD